MYPKEYYLNNFSSNDKQIYSNLNFYNLKYQKMKKKKKIGSTNLYMKYPMFNNDNKSIKKNNYLDNSNNLKANNFINSDIKSENSKKIGINDYNKSIDKDLDMMKIQLRCDLITQKIYQIQDQVQSLHESSIKDDLNLFSKNKNNSFENVIDNELYYKNYQSLSNREKPNLIRNTFSVENRKQQNILNKRINNSRNNNKSETIYISKGQNNYPNNSLITNNIKNMKVINNKDNKNSQKYFFLNLNNSNSSAPKFSSNQFIYMKDKNLKRQKDNLSNAKNINKNFSQICHLNNKRSISNNNIFISKCNPNLINNGNNNSSYNVKYGSYDKYFFNDNNYTDYKYLKYIQKINNNFSYINYNNLEKLKNDTFNKDDLDQINQINKILNKSNYVIRNENNININSDNNNIKQIIKGNNLQMQNIINNSLNFNKSLSKNKNNMVEEKNGSFILNKNLKNKNNSVIHKGEYIKNPNTYKLNKEKNNDNINKTDININNINKIKKYSQKIISDKKQETNITDYRENKTSDRTFNIENNKFILNNNNNYSKNLNSSFQNDSNSKNESINFKININNVSNYSINNNCVNLNNDNNNNNMNENIETNKETENKISNKHDYSEEKKDENLKINPDYSNDDILQNLDNLITGNEKEKIEIIKTRSDYKNENNNEINNNKENEKNNILKYNKNKKGRNRQIDIIDIDNSHKKLKSKNIIKRNKENNNNFINNKFIKQKNNNTVNYLNDDKNKLNSKIMPIKDIKINTQSNNKYNMVIKDENNSKKIKKIHKIFCHKFTDNPQHFFTVKLTESMIKQLIKIKNKNKKGS